MHAEVADHPLFTGSIPVGIMSGESPRFPSAGDHEALLRELQQMGVQHEDTTGRYGAPEHSVLIYGLPREQMVALGKKYGQESVIHSENGRHHLIYTNGPNAGHYHEDVPGQHEYFPAGSPEPADNYTKLPGGGYFRIGFDFDKLHPDTQGGADVPRGAAAGPVTKHEIAHRLYAAVSEVLAKAEKAKGPTVPCPKCGGSGLHHLRNLWGDADLKCEHCMGHGKVLAEPDRTKQHDHGLQRSEPVAKADVLRPSGHRRVQAEAAEYMRSAGLHPESGVSHTVDHDLLHRAAGAYEQLRHDPSDPEVRRSYDALKRETMAQYDHLVRAGYKFEPHSAASLVPTAFADGPLHPDTAFVAHQGAPYKNDAELAADIGNNKHLYVFPEGEPPPDHPLAEKIPGHPLKTYNNVFRAVHDVFGHAKTGADFGHYGEDHAWRSHAAMFSPLARRALTTETRGQNAAFHFGQNGATNRANPTQAVFPDQKAALMPEEFSRLPGEPVRKSADLNLNVQERSAVADDQKPSDPRMALHGLYKTLREEVEAYEAECVALRKAETARLEKKAPPGFSEDTMHELKRKHGVESAFKIAWAAYDKKHGKKPVKKDEESPEASASPAPECPSCGGHGTELGSLGKRKHFRCRSCGMDFSEVKKDEVAPRDPATGIAKTSATDGGMGVAPSAPVPGNAGDSMAMSEDDARAEAYAKGEMDLCKACGLMKGPKHDCDEVEKYAKGEMGKSTKEEDEQWEADKVQAQLDSKKQKQPQAHPYRKDELDKNIGGRMPGPDAPSTPPPPPPPAPGIAKDELDGDGARAPKTDHGSQLPAGSSPTSPGPKPGVVPSTKDPKVQLPQTKEGGNGVAIKKAALPAAPSAAGAAAPKPPKLPGVKAPKLPGIGKPAAPKTPPMGAGTPAPNLKAEPEPVKKEESVALNPTQMAQRRQLGERDQAAQRVKLPGVRASVGNLMDNMLAGGQTPLNPGQPLSIKPIASAPAVPVGVRPSPTGGQAPAPQPRAAIPMVQRVAASLTPPPAAERAGAKLPGAHLFAPKAVKAEVEPMEKEHLGFDKLKNKLAHKPGIDNPGAVAAKIGREKLGEKEMARRSKEGKK